MLSIATGKDNSQDKSCFLTLYVGAVLCPQVFIYFPILGKELQHQREENTSGGGIANCEDPCGFPGNAYSLK